jgi:hypothetical protein
MIIAAIVLIAIVGVAALWLRGDTSVVFPGLGIVVSSGLVLAFLIVIEALIVMLAAYLARHSLL